MVTRRSVLGTTALAAVGFGLPAMTATAQDATPEAETVDAGYAIFRVRELPTPELSEAITANVMSGFLPGFRELAGYAGYVFAFDTDNPAGQHTLALTADPSGADDYTTISQDFVATLDPRFDPALLDQTDGPVRSWTVTTRTLSELPPNLAGCSMTTRNRENAEGVDVEHLATLVNDELAPIFAAMPGFVMYAYILTETGRVGINIWETTADRDAGDQAVADWAAEHTAGTWVGDVTVHNGTIYFAELAGLKAI